MKTSELVDALQEIKASLELNRDKIKPLLPQLDQLYGVLNKNRNLLTTFATTFNIPNVDEWLEAFRAILEQEHKFLDTTTNDSLIKTVDFISNRTIILNMIAPFI